MSKKTILAIIIVALGATAFFIFWSYSSVPTISVPPTEVSTTTSNTATSSGPLTLGSGPVPPASTTKPPVAGQTAVIAGPISNLSSKGMKLQGKVALWTVTFTSETKFQKYNTDGTKLLPMAFSEIANGQSLRVIGTVAADGSVVARTVTSGNPAKKPAV